MYTELKELVNFIATFMRRHVPRRRICMFMEYYANYLLVRFNETWDIDDPKDGEKDRQLNLKWATGYDETFELLASSLGVNSEDALLSLPETITVYCNPGEVYCHINDQLVEIWSGDVFADFGYVATPIGAPQMLDGGSKTVVNAKPGITISANPATNISRIQSGQLAVTLNLADSNNVIFIDLLASNLFWNFEAPKYLFYYVPTGCQPVGIQAFGSTRFGSRRSRPDHGAMRRIQHAAAFMAVAENVAIREKQGNAGNGVGLSNFQATQLGNGCIDGHSDRFPNNGSIPWAGRGIGPNRGQYESIVPAGLNNFMDGQYNGMNIEENLSMCNLRSMNNLAFSSGYQPWSIESGNQELVNVCGAQAVHQFGTQQNDLSSFVQQNKFGGAQISDRMSTNAYRNFDRSLNNGFGVVKEQPRQAMDFVRSVGPLRQFVPPYHANGAVH